MDGLTPGRIVHFVSDRDVKADDPHTTVRTAKLQHVPALVTGVLGDGDGLGGPDLAGYAHLSIHYPGVALPEARVSVAFDSTGATVNTWHWIERA